MVALTLFGTLGCLLRPFYGVAIYYLFAVLRPQAIWQWSLPPDMQWSRFVGLAALGSVVLGIGGRGRTDEQRPARGLSHALFLLNFVWLCVCYLTAHDREAAFVYFNEYIKI